MFIQFALKPAPPFRLDLTVWVLRRQSANIIDQWENDRYVRILTYDNQPVKVAVYQEGTVRKPRLMVEAESKYPTRFSKSRIIAIMKKILGFNIGLDKFYKIVNNDADLQELTYRFIGLKPPRFPSVFEAAVNAITCQQITLDASIKLLNRLSRQYGHHFDNELCAFPTPENLYQLKARDLRKLGFSYQKAKAIIELSIAAVNQKVWLEQLENENIIDAYSYLHNIKGIGRWSSEYILLRGLGKLNVLPGDDSGTQKKLQEYFHTEDKLSYERVKQLTYRWQPYAGFIYFHLLLNKIFKKEPVAKPLVVTYT